MACGMNMLPKEYEKCFEILLDNVPPQPTSYIKSVIEDELKIKIDEVFMNFRDKPLGAASIVKEINEGVIVADLVRIRIDPQKIDNEFLCFQLNSSHIKAKINSYTRGATRPRIKLDVIRNLQINYPHIDEQKNISKKLNQVLTEISNYIKIINEIGNQLELLEMSLLRTF